LGRLGDWGLVGQAGRTQATRYFVKPELLRSLAFPAVTTLKRIEEHRLRALVLEDLGRYPTSAIGDIHKRIGLEIPRRRLQGMLTKLLADGQVSVQGERRWARYALVL
jgi:ATP-dependent DNA helicase RecG